MIRAKFIYNKICYLNDFGGNDGHTTTGTQRRAHNNGHTTTGTQQRAHNNGHKTTGTQRWTESYTYNVI